MISAYHRPATLEAALSLLARSQPETLPLGGGGALTRPSARQFEVVDLQALGLDKIEDTGSQIVAGAAVSLQALIDHPSTPPALAQAIALETNRHLRHTATLAGALVTAGGRSPLAAALLALDARLTWQPGDFEVSLGDWLPLRAGKRTALLITSVAWSSRARLAFFYSARSPEDRPIVTVAAAQWASGRARLAVGGWGSAPLLAMDGPEAAGAETAAHEATADASDDWASAEYRQSAAGMLARRAFAALQPAGQVENR